MFRLLSERSCAICSHTIRKWHSKTTNSYEFYVRCSNCNVINTLHIPNKIEISEFASYIQKHDIKPRISTGEYIKLETARKSRRIPNHIPDAQVYKYINKKVENWISGEDRG